MTQEPNETGVGLGVLTINLGSPDAPTAPAVRRYLREFLWDRRVVDAPRLPWWLVLNGIILNVRPRRSARLYRRIWTPQGSPLPATGRRQARALAERLAERLGCRISVALGMRYGRPSIGEAIETLRQAGCRRMLILPLYPQYSASTTASAFDAVAQALSRRRRIPELRMVADYHNEPAYLNALATSVREVWSKADGPPDRLMISFHGLPVRYAREGDPYPGQCQATAEALAERLALGPGQWRMAFQSRFGREPWLEPCTHRILREWGEGGVGRVDVICPGFAADCLETLEEIAQAGRDAFLRAGGKQFRYIPALNDRPDHIEALADLSIRHLEGWGVGRRLPN